jgi:hypothetical protein
MNRALISELIQLRYKLLWAKTRSRNGRIALFLSGYLLLVLLLILLGAGGMGAAIAAVKAGRTALIAQAVFGGIFVQAVISSNILGFGLNAVFSDTELRRYPLAAADRVVARHLIGILDPFWFLFLAMQLGLAIGLYALGAAGFWLGVTAVLLLWICNYLMARVVGVFVDHLVKRKGGAAILMSFVMLLAFAPGPMAPLFKKNPQLGAEIVQRLAITPPFLAASALVGQVTALPLLFLWIGALAALLIYLEKRPPQRQAAASVKIVWDTPFDRVGALFSPRLAPFVSHWLCFYTRNPRTRTMLAISLPLTAFLTYSTGRQIGPRGLFIAALGTLPMATFLGTARFSVNLFGYCGGAFRRYFLLPTNPADALRAASYSAILMGSAILPIALTLWIAFAGLPFDLRMVLMLACSGITGLLFLNTCGVWVTLFNPRKGNYFSNFGNDLPLGGNIILIGGMIFALILPRVLYKILPAAVAPENWWAFLALPILALVFYLVTLNLAGPIFNTRRERLLAVIEGRD